MTKRINSLARKTANKLTNDLLNNPEKYRNMWKAWFMWAAVEKMPEKTFDQWLAMMIGLSESVYISLKSGEHPRERNFSQEESHMRVSVEILGKGTAEEPWHCHATIMLVHEELIW